jgi:hypothetical protein
MDNIDIIELIARACDPSTCMHLLTANKEIYRELHMLHKRVLRKLSFEWARQKIKNHVAELPGRIWSWNYMNVNHIRCSMSEYTIVKNKMCLNVHRVTSFWGQGVCERSTMLVGVKTIENRGNVRVLVRGDRGYMFTRSMRDITFCFAHMTKANRALSLKSL